VSESSPDEAKFSSNKVLRNIKIEGSKAKKWEPQLKLILAGASTPSFA
jgi:hypothetical protein